MLRLTTLNLWLQLIVLFTANVVAVDVSNPLTLGKFAASTAASGSKPSGKGSLLEIKDLLKSYTPKT